MGCRRRRRCWRYRLVPDGILDIFELVLQVTGESIHHVHEVVRFDPLYASTAVVLSHSARDAASAAVEQMTFLQIPLYRYLPYLCTKNQCW